ncbi:MAG: hypothetical protein SGPRY_008896, partial [Prymnesium sp.]
MLATLAALTSSAVGFHAGAPARMHAPATQRIAMMASKQARALRSSASLGAPPPRGRRARCLLRVVDVSSADKVIELNDRQSCDTQLLCNGGFSPLTGFMTEEEYNAVVTDMRLPSGLIMGLPVVMDTFDDSIEEGQKLLLTYKGTNMAMMTVTSKWKPDKPLECVKAYGTGTIEHPGVRMVAMERGPTYIGGPVVGIDTPVRDFPCQTPAEVREQLPDDVDVVAFQCRNPVHRAHYELFTRALDAPNVGKDAVVLVHPTCGPTQEDDIPGTVRYKTYEVLIEETKETPSGKRTRWAYLPYSMHMAGPREAIQHMIIRKNFGCTHFIIGRDMAGSKSSVDGEDFYGAFDAQDFAKANAEELGVQPVPSLNLVCSGDDESFEYITADEAKEKGLEIKKLSGTKFRQMLRAGEEIPEWFAFKSVVE